MLTINAPAFDLGGHVTLMGVEPHGLKAFQRRNNRIPTLNGGAVIPDFGYSDADRTLDVRWEARDASKVETVIRLAKTYSRLIVSTEEGCFYGAPGPFDISDGVAQIQILVEKRIDQ